MERLTYKDEMGYHLKLEHEDADTVTALGLYEDTGLTPKDIEIIHKENLYHSAFCDLLLEELQDCEESEKAGRLVHLPCKIGDEAWGIRNIGKTKHLMSGVVTELYYSQEMRLIARIRGICGGEVGKAIFITREEAEAALKKG